MSYQVLARKWRPKVFSELVGQEHVVRALTNALKSGQMHHAYLFAGTRGIGKTTIARIVAKSLNCEKGPTAEPCGSCAVCQAVDAGRFVDLLEIDAASNTGVDDVRELIDNAQYAPSQGRFKVYLIDEVHMLSRSAFNALLKTLEEPPEHVKFLLATTDPDKLPMTVLSRCLKFNLKRLRPAQIAGQLQHILDAENIDYDEAATEALALAADGSMRDGLSLLDQALAYGDGALRTDGTRDMLGTIGHGEVVGLLQALADADGEALMQQAETVAEHAPDFAAVLDQMAAVLHAVQLQQLVPGHREATAAGQAEVGELANALAADEVQLWYQFAVHGRDELELAPDLRTGFEMVLLRMLAFRPGMPGNGDGPRATATRQAVSRPVADAPTAAVPARPAAGMTAQAPASPAAATKASGVEEVPPAELETLFTDPAHCAEDWHRWLQQRKLSGPVGELARNAVLQSVEDGAFTLTLRPTQMNLAVEPLVQSLQKRLAADAGRPVRLHVVAADAEVDSPAERQRLSEAERHEAARRSIAEDPVVRSLEQELDARVMPDSVRPQ